MKKLPLTLALLTTATLANDPIGAQTFQNGPYYAPPSWDQQIPAAQRFIVLSNWSNDAVLDRETGLVWQRSPDTVKQRADWGGSVLDCHILGSSATGVGVPGNRLGWRLPSVEELASLVDIAQTNPTLPAGHPFQGIQNTFYWAATVLETNPAAAYVVGFSDGSISFDVKSAIRNFWCVRGGSGIQNPQ